MFESLTSKLTAVFAKLNNKGLLTETNIQEGLRDIRIALLEADVNFRVAKILVDRVKSRAIGTEVLGQVSPGQQVIKIVHEEMTNILGGNSSSLINGNSQPSTVMLVGLQGAGKTTTAAKLALHLKDKGHRPLLVAADLQRPAAIKQLQILGDQLGIHTYSESGNNPTALEVSIKGLDRARQMGSTWAIIDTAGRLHIDAPMMSELLEIKNSLNPTEIIMVVDSMTGQDAVQSAQTFHENIGLTGLIMTKMDGDTRGGAALSISQVTGLPIKFVGTGERMQALEPFHPDRVASRILGMGDILTLVERAQQALGDDNSDDIKRRILKSTFTLDDFLDQIHQITKLGPLGQIMELIPGFSSMAKKLSSEDVDTKNIKRMEAILYSMTVRERRKPTLINGSRKRRIAKGSGTTPQDVNQLLNQFRQMQKILKQASSGKLPRNLTEMFR